MITENWKTAVNDKKLMGIFLGGVSCSILMLFVFRIFLLYNETRTGIKFDDPILKWIPPHDLTWFTFIMIHSFWIAGVMLILSNPLEGAIWAYSYSFLLMFRVCTLYLLPLEPPPGMIFLNDPIVALFIQATTPVKDLFFSGHTATAFLIYLGIKDKRVKPLFLAASIIIGLCVLIQHVHYSIDVLAAPFFAYFSFKFAQRLIGMAYETK